MRFPPYAKFPIRGGIQLAVYAQDRWHARGILVSKMAVVLVDIIPIRASRNRQLLSKP